MQLVKSLCGVWEGEDGVKEGGGLDSLARAMQRLGTREEGKFKCKVEYLSPVGTLRSPTKFLPRFYAACRSVPPLDFLTQSTPEAVEAKKSFATAQDGDERVVLIYRTEDALAGHDGKEPRYHVKWESGIEWDAASTQMKKDRVIGATTVLILHMPLEQDKVGRGEEGYETQYQGFLYVDSHTPTPSSWGSFTTPSPSSSDSSTLYRHDLGVVFRTAAEPTWSALLKEVNKRVPYKRLLEKYAKGDRPAETVVKPPREEKGKEKEEKKKGGKGKGKGRKERGGEVSEAGSEEDGREEGALETLA
ncbi:hypothetical protein JCM8547_002152 [Rhodosporidiobolus lusitaniae]